MQRKFYPLGRLFDSARLVSGKALVIALLLTPTLYAQTEETVAIPEVGKFMMINGKISLWAQPTEETQTVIDEPINVIVRVKSTSLAEATERLTQALAVSGFTEREGHSTGYTASIQGRLYPQLPTGNDLAFSDAPFLTTNNHGRFFGPSRWSRDGDYYFIGAFSRETPNFLDLIRFGPDYLHGFISFNQAREALAENLQAHAGAKNLGPVAIKNLVNRAQETTADHDGMAVLLELKP